ncbi:hypothetical protein BH10PSE13_BH10PSE13_09720 [soil metagenome]
MNVGSKLVLGQISSRFAVAGLVTVSIFSPVGQAQQSMAMGDETKGGVVNPYKPLTEIESGRLNKAFGVCLYDRGGTSADIVLKRSDPISVDVPRTSLAAKFSWLKFAIQICAQKASLDRKVGISKEDIVGISMRTNLRRIRGMLAEEAYLTRFHEVPQTQSVAVPNRVFVSTGKELEEAKSLASLADCMVSSNGTGADALLRTMPGTVEEKSVARSLSPALGSCLFAGQEFSMSPLSVRALAADGLWTRYVGTKH